MNVEAIVRRIVEWAKAEPFVEAVALVGSRARGTARTDSDIDIVVLTARPEDFRADTTWLEKIGWDSIDARLWKWEDEDYGRLWSRRLWLQRNGGEIEISFTCPAWADVTPVDEGTHHIVAAGCCILHDPKQILARLCAAVAALPR